MLLTQLTYLLNDHCITIKPNHYRQQTSLKTKQSTNS